VNSYKAKSSHAMPYAMACQIEEYGEDKQGIVIMVQYITTPGHSK
jgi:hypothetical protein